jgi:hypothetical protein
MTTSQMQILSKPTGEEQIPEAELAYIRARGRQQQFNFLHTELRRSGISQATLKRRLGKRAEVISRILMRPTNLEQDTFSEIIFAITGGSFAYRLELPMTLHPPQPTRTEIELDQPTIDKRPPLATRSSEGEAALELELA